MDTIIHLCNCSSSAPAVLPLQEGFICSHCAKIQHRTRQTAEVTQARDPSRQIAVSSSNGLGMHEKALVEKKSIAQLRYKVSMLDTILSQWSKCCGCLGDWRAARVFFGDADKLNNSSAANWAAVELLQKVLILAFVFLTHMWCYRHSQGGFL